MTRRALAFALVASVPLVFALAVPDVGARGRGHATPAGTWMIKIDFNFIIDPDNPDETVPFDLAYLQDFDADGRTTVLLPTGPGHPNEGDTRVGCMGEWRPRKGHGRTYDLTMRCLYDQNGENPYGEIRGVMKMKGKDAFKAEFSYVDHYADGSILYFQGWGVMNGTRIKVNPLP